MLENTSEEFRKAYAKFQSEVENPKLDKVNPHFKSRYASIGACLTAVKPALKSSNLILLQNKTYANDDCYMITRLIHVESGDGIVDSSKLKASVRAQEFGSEQTYAKRYGICTVCGIVGEEDDDGNEANKSEKQINAKAIKSRYLSFLKNKYKEQELNDQIQKAKSLSLEDMQRIMHG